MSVWIKNVKKNIELYHAINTVLHDVLQLKEKKQIEFQFHPRMGSSAKKDEKVE